MNQEAVQNTMLQYGVLGIVAFALAYFAWTQYTRLAQKNDELEAKVDKLQDEMMQLLVEERDNLSQLIRENTEAMRGLQNAVLEYIVKSRD